MRSEEELRRLATPEFSRRLASDPELRELERLRYDRAGECRLLLETLGLGDYRIGQMPVRPLTAAKWAVLWMIGSPFAVGGRVTETDVSVALYLLSRWHLGEIPGALHEIPALASGFAAEAGLPLAQTVSHIHAMISTAFRPLALLPLPPPSEEEVRFDAQWLIRIAGIAAREANITLESAMHDLPLATVCGCYLARYEHENGGKTPHHHSDPEIDARISARISALEEEFLKRGTDDAEGMPHQA